MHVLIGFGILVGLVAAASSPNAAQAAIVLVLGTAAGMALCVIGFIAYYGI
jgi:hypothetical protein